MINLAWLIVAFLGGTAVLIFIVSVCPWFRRNDEEMERIYEQQRKEENP